VGTAAPFSENEIKLVKLLSRRRDLAVSRNRTRARRRAFRFIRNGLGCI